MYNYGIVCFTCISISSVVGRRVCADACKYIFYRNCIYNRLPADELSEFETCRRYQKIKKKIRNLKKKSTDYLDTVTLQV